VFLFFFLKACIIFEKKDAFGAVERRLEKKLSENFQVSGPI
jgi:hypothetical protein